MRGLIKSPWKSFSRRVARNDLVRCAITAVNSDGSFDVRRIGVAEGTADIKHVPSVTKNDVYLVGDIASLGFAEGDPQKPFLFGFVNGGAKHVSVVVNPLPVPELGYPPISYVAPIGEKIYRVWNSASFFYWYSHPTYGRVGGQIKIGYTIQIYDHGIWANHGEVYPGYASFHDWGTVTSYYSSRTNLASTYSSSVAQNQIAHISSEINSYAGPDTGGFVEDFLVDYFSEHDPTQIIDSTEFNIFLAGRDNYFSNYT